ncbi:MAG TPA: acyl-CoA thioesterase [Paracoccus sp. (in: a-proteobacteria)]|uniref:acyl-CoA thioesterase n=1 Tax=uncultured Paracoccus sp. TaxID=189685 RepID=UPI00260BD548|nr:acyl-CoA thioesterase [uncultured Paracoccus sp.]HMQ41071.1 acyl-CoA thioesterase [Paracoccus sp. (in: a-proteobacteria)]HMR34731.1 acyl-CoA thioesterase [Paracoccus sp. (in: a-proteobacteria)]
MQDAPQTVMETTQLVLPAQANHYGTLFAGDALSLMTGAAYAVAARHARGNVVLASVAEARFTAPVPVGSLLILRAEILKTGRSAILVEVTAQGEDPQTGHRILAAQGQFNMVAVNDRGRPRKINAEEKLP